MADVKIKHNKDGYYQLRIAPGPVGFLNQIGMSVLAQLQGNGGKWAMGSRVGAKRPQGRQRVGIVTADYKARRLAAKGNVMEMAVMNAVRG